MRLPDLSGKVVVITGAGRGIGAVTSRFMAAAGASVIAAVKPGSGNEALEKRHDLRGQITTIECDVRRDDDVLNVFNVTSNTHKHLDALVNSAGMIAPIGHIQDVDTDQWMECLAVNAGGAFRCTKTFLPMLLAAKGTIVNVSSGAAYRPLEGWSAYCSSKAALVMLSRASMHEYGERGLRVFALGVPPTDTKMQALIRASGLNPISQIPREKLEPPETAAAVIAWLCGPEAHVVKEIEVDVRDPLFTYLRSEKDV